MTLMTTTTRWGEPLTLADRDAMPDLDGRRYELIAGSIVVTPAPLTGHQRGSRRLQRLLEDAAPPHTEVFNAPVDLRLPAGHVLQPDLLVAPAPSIVRTHIELPVLLVVEIVSLGSHVHDTITKRAVYAEAGIEHYWLVDTTRSRPWFTALRLVDGEFDTVIDTGGEAATDAPLAVQFAVADLFRPPR